MSTNQKDKGRIYSKRYRERHREKIRIYDKERRPQTQVSRKILARLREEKGNCCAGCGYKTQPRILHFHHLRDKLFNLSDYGFSEEKKKAEADKCILLCPNCHALAHLTE